MHENALLKGRSTLVAMVTTAACSWPEASFSYKNVAKKKRVKCLFLYHAVVYDGNSLPVTICFHVYEL